jgi:hypothetical protein
MVGDIRFVNTSLNSPNETIKSDRQKLKESTVIKIEIPTNALAQVVLTIDYNHQLLKGISQLIFIPIFS